MYLCSEFQCRTHYPFPQSPLKNEHHLVRDENRTNCSKKVAHCEEVVKVEHTRAIVYFVDHVMNLESKYEGLD